MISWLSAGLADWSAGGVYDGAVLLLRLPTQSHDVAVGVLGPNGPGYR